MFMSKLNTPLHYDENVISRERSIYDSDVVCMNNQLMLFFLFQ